jgi:hypothetical protein
MDVNPFSIMETSHEWESACVESSHAKCKLSMLYKHSFHDYCHSTQYHQYHQISPTATQKPRSENKTLGNLLFGW